ncbi:unnamed protein product [Urochloa humidicola]
MQSRPSIERSHLRSTTHPNSHPLNAAAAPSQNPNPLPPPLSAVTAASSSPSLRRCILLLTARRSLAGSHPHPPTPPPPEPHPRHLLSRRHTEGARSGGGRRSGLSAQGRSARPHPLPPPPPLASSSTPAAAMPLRFEPGRKMSSRGTRKWRGRREGVRHGDGAASARPWRPGWLQRRQMVSLHSSSATPKRKSSLPAACHAAASSPLRLISPAPPPSLDLARRLLPAALDPPLRLPRPTSAAASRAPHPRCLLPSTSRAASSPRRLILPSTSRSASSPPPPAPQPAPPPPASLPHLLRSIPFFLLGFESDDGAGCSCAGLESDGDGPSTCISSCRTASTGLHPHRSFFCSSRVVNGSILALWQCKFKNRSISS